MLLKFDVKTRLKNKIHLKHVTKVNSMIFKLRSNPGSFQTVLNLSQSSAIIQVEVRRLTDK